jgi:hypothetical protein
MRECAPFSGVRQSCSEGSTSPNRAKQANTVRTSHSGTHTVTSCRTDHLELRVRVEIMGPGKCESVGKSQSVLIMIDPTISTRTRSVAPGLNSVVGVIRSGCDSAHALTGKELEQAVAQRRPAPVAPKQEGAVASLELRAVEGQQVARPIDAPCVQCLRHGDPMHAQKQLTAARAPAPARAAGRALRSVACRAACPRPNPLGQSRRWKGHLQ